MGGLGNRRKEIDYKAEMFRALTDLGEAQGYVPSIFMVAKEESKTFWPLEPAYNFIYKHGGNTLINNYLKSSLNLPQSIKLQIKKYKAFHYFLKKLRQEERKKHSCSLLSKSWLVTIKKPIKFFCKYINTFVNT